MTKQDNFLPRFAPLLRRAFLLHIYLRKIISHTSLNRRSCIISMKYLLEIFQYRFKMALNAPTISARVSKSSHPTHSIRRIGNLSNHPPKGGCEGQWLNDAKGCANCERTFKHRFAPVPSPGTKGCERSAWRGHDARDGDYNHGWCLGLFESIHL